VSAIRAAEDDGCVIVGKKYLAGFNTGYDRDIFILKVDSTGKIVSTNEPMIHEIHFLVYPNPSEGQLHINSTKYAHSLLKLYDLKGELMASDKIEAGVNDLDYSILPAGTYIYGIEVQGAEVQQGKWIKIK
jgi:hypothetical protein